MKLKPSGSSDNYNYCATALGFSTQQVLDWLGPDSAVLVTYLYDARLIGKETRRSPNPLRYTDQFTRNLVSVFPGCAFWLVGGEETAVRTPSMKFAHFLKDIRSGHEWSGTKDQNRRAKAAASRAPLPKSLRRKLENQRGGKNSRWLVPHCHAILVVIGSDGRVVPSAVVQMKVSNIQSARHQVQVERIGDKGEWKKKRSIGQHGLSIVEYLIKPELPGTEEEKQQRRWRKFAPNSGLFDIVIDAETKDKIQPLRGELFTKALDDFLRVRTEAHVASGLQNQHFRGAGHVDEVMTFLARRTRSVPNTPTHYSLPKAIRSSVESLSGFLGKIMGKMSKVIGLKERVNEHDPP